MRILFVNEYSFDFLGGVELHILNLAREYARLGHSVTLVYRNGSGESDYIHPAGLRMIRLPTLEKLVRYLGLNSNSFDVCHAHMSRKAYACVALVASKRLHLPT